jgi:hypothetical protein
MFHQAAMRGASDLLESAYNLAAADGEDETAAAELRRAVAQWVRGRLSVWLHVA